MYKRILITAFCSLFFLVLSQAQQLASSGKNYKLKKVIQVAGRQGIAADKDFYYVSSSTALYKYDKAGNLLMKNDEPFKNLQKQANHFGDIDVYNGKIYTGIEWFMDGVGKDIQIAVYDAKTLKYEYSIDFDPSSGQVEVCGITIDRDRKTAWLADWVNGRYLYRYDLATGKYQGKLHLRPVPQYQQGIFYADGKILISADDGDADFNENDNIYSVDIKNLNKTAAYVSHFKELKEFKRTGEVEGLCIDPSNNNLLVLNNRGSRIVLGMVKGFYDGYTEEIHELYIYECLK
jgi:outer membrane protein assembly factor BamB